eukprot:s5819_g3.t1
MMECWTWGSDCEVFILLTLASDSSAVWRRFGQFSLLHRGLEGFPCECIFIQLGRRRGATTVFHFALQVHNHNLYALSTFLFGLTRHRVPCTQFNQPLNSVAQFIAPGHIMKSKEEKVKLMPGMERTMDRSSSAGELSVRSLNGRGVPLQLKKSRSGVLLPPLSATSPGLPSMTRQLRTTNDNLHGVRTQPFCSSVWSVEKSRSLSHSRAASFGRLEAWPGEQAAVRNAAREAAQARQKPDTTEEEAIAKKLVDLDMPHLDRITSMYIGQSFADMDGDGEKSPEDILPTQELGGLLKQNNGGIEVNEDELESQELQLIQTGEEIAVPLHQVFCAKSTKNRAGCHCLFRQEWKRFQNKVANLAELFPRALDLCLLKGSCMPIVLRASLSLLQAEITGDQVNPEYFTISATGIVHVAPGQLSECISLTDWMHQSLMFRVLQTINFFKFYMHKKVITQWSTNARYEVYCHHRQRLSRCCFFAKPMFVDSLVQVNSLVREVEEVKVMHIDQNYYTIQEHSLLSCSRRMPEFMDKQQQIRASPVNSAQKDFEQKHESAIGIIDRLITTVQCSLQIEPSVDQLSGNKPDTNP